MKTCEKIIDILKHEVYTLSVYMALKMGGERIMKTARVFKSGNSQAVRLPKDFKLDVAEVQVFRKDGDLILRPLQKNWQDYFARGRRFSDDFPDVIEDPAPEEKNLW